MKTCSPVVGLRLQNDARMGVGVAGDVGAMNDEHEKGKNERDGNNGANVHADALFLFPFPIRSSARRRSARLRRFLRFAGLTLKFTVESSFRFC